MRHRFVPVLFVAVMACQAIGCTGQGEVLEATTTATSQVTPATQRIPATTVPPSPDASQQAGSARMAPPSIEVTWTLLSTLDGGWLTEPVADAQGYLAVRRGLSPGVVEGWINPTQSGELWQSSDGITWVPASDDQTRPVPEESASTREASVIVDVMFESEPNRDTERLARLLASSDGSIWREVNLRPYQDDWSPTVAGGGFGWLVHSPPMAARATSSFPRQSNLGLWYTPDTEAWFEVTDLGPLADYARIGNSGVWDVAMIVRDDDILVFAFIGQHLGFGHGRDYRTEVWQLQLQLSEPFDFSTQSLCDWFSPEEIDAIVVATYEEAGVPLDPEAELDQRDGQNSDCHWSWPVVTLSEWEDSFDWDGTAFAAHPALDNSVQASIGNPPGTYGLMNGVSALLTVDGHPESLWFGHGGFHERYDVETRNTVGLTIANEMLIEMGWINSP
ncbi:MAG: hypothetical protein ACR2N9_07830 [Acidimicrobiia bacterium]